MDVLEYFGFKEDPFKITPDPVYFFPSVAHKECLDSLEYSVGAKEGFTLITGEPGTGKTTLLKVFIEAQKTKAEAAVILTPHMSPADVLPTLMDDFGLSYHTSNKNEQLTIFRDFLIAKAKEGKNVIVIIDEAQDLPTDTLEELRLLSNLETHSEKLIHIVLFGQTELEDKLKARELRQLDQRIITRTRITALNESETNDYINFRLARAGRGYVKFEDSARTIVYNHTRGNPRLINVLCTRVLMAVFLKESNKVRRSDVLNAIESLRPANVSARQSKDTFVNFLLSSAIIVVVIFSVVVFTRLKGFDLLQLLSIRTNIRTMQNHDSVAASTNSQLNTTADVPGGASTQGLQPQLSPLNTKPSLTTDPQVQKEGTPKSDALPETTAPQQSTPASTPTQEQTQVRQTPVNPPVNDQAPVAANQNIDATPSDTALIHNASSLPAVTPASVTIAPTTANATVAQTVTQTVAPTVAPIVTPNALTNTLPDSEKQKEAPPNDLQGEESKLPETKSFEPDVTVAKVTEIKDPQAKFKDLSKPPVSAVNKDTIVKAGAFGFINRENVNVRSAHSLTASVIGFANGGDKVIIYKKGTDESGRFWYLIEDTHGTKGWVSEKVITLGY